VPDLFLTAEQTSEDAKALNAPLLNYFVDNTSPYKYMCQEGVKVFQERSVCLPHLPPWVTAEMITSHFMDVANVSPTQVVLDSVYKQKVGSTSWVAEFGRVASDCEEGFKDVDAAMASNNSTFLHPVHGQHVIKLQLLRKRTPGE
jgi:hypothetical protein